MFKTKKSSAMFCRGRVFPVVPPQLVLSKSQIGPHAVTGAFPYCPTALSDSPLGNVFGIFRLTCLAPTDSSLGKRKICLLVFVIVL